MHILLNTLFSTKEIVKAIQPPGSQRHMGLGREAHNYVRRHFYDQAFSDPLNRCLHTMLMHEPTHIMCTTLLYRNQNVNTSAYALTT